EAGVVAPLPPWRGTGGIVRPHCGLFRPHPPPHLLRLSRPLQQPPPRQRRPPASPRRPRAPPPPPPAPPPPRPPPPPAGGRGGVACCLLSAPPSRLPRLCYPWPDSRRLRPTAASRCCPVCCASPRAPGSTS